MSVTLTDLRERHGSVFVTETPDGLIVPFKPLSLGEFMEYDQQFRTGAVDHCILENEIFTKCVTDKTLVKNIFDQKAGTVSAVAKAVMDISGPSSLEELNGALNYFREIATQPMHQLVSIICRAFPGYTPDDIYEMDFQKMTLRLAQAESKLMALGMLQEPIEIYAKGEPEKKKERPSIKVDPQKLKEAFDLQKTQPMHERLKKAKEAGKKKLELSQEREVDELDLGSTTNGETFIVDANLMLLGLEVGDENDAKAMKRDSKAIYADYLKMGNKVKIKTVEERLEEAQARSEANRKKNLEAARKKRPKK